MSNSIRNFFSPPFFPDDEDKTRTARVLYALLANMLAVLALIVIATIFVVVQKTGASIVVFLLLAVVLISYALAQRGRVQLASVLFVAGMWVVISLLLGLTGKIGTAATALHIAVAVIAGVLLGRRSAILIAALSIIAGLGLAILENAGYSLVHYFAAAPLPNWIVWVTAFLMALTALNLTLQGSAQALARARQSERRYVTLFEAAPMMYLTVYNDRGVPIISNCNAAFTETLGYRRDQIIGQPLSKFYTPQSQAALLEGGGFQRALRGEMKTLVERDLVTQEGHVIHTLLQVTPELDETGQAIGTLIMFLDITDRKQAVEALQKSEELYRQAIEVAGAVPYLQSYRETGTGVHYDFIGEGIRQITGYGPDEFTGKLWGAITEERVLVEDLAAYSWSEAIRRVRSGESPIWKCEHRIRARDGEIHWVFEAAVELRDENGVSHGSIGLYQDITGRKRVEEALRMSEEKFRRLFETSRDFLYITNIDGEIIEVNNAASTMSGYSVDELKKINIQELYCDPNERDLVVKEISERGFVENLEVKGKKRDGTVVDTLVTSTVIKDNDGNVVGFQGSIKDISERKRAEESLRKSEEKFAKAFQASPIIVVIGQLSNGRLIEVNESFEKVTGYTREEALGHTTTELGIVNLAERERLLPILLANGRLRNEELQIRSKSGAVVTCLYSAELIELDGEKCTLGLIENITARKRAEQERERLTAQVREQAQQLQQILATVPTGVLLLDAGWRVMQANPAAEEDLTVLAGAHVGDGLTHLGNRPLAELLTSPPTKGLWHEVKTQNRIFEAIARPVESGAMPEHWVLVFNDVTREREVQAQLQQQERLAVVGQLAAGIAHDFNNIMAIIVLYAQMGLRGPNISPKLRERLEVVSQQARRATDLIQQILDFSRQTVLDRRAMDLRPFLKEVVKLLERTIPENIKIDLVCKDDEYVVSADPTRLQQVVMNLVVNARDAMPEGGNLHISLSKIAEIDKAKCVICGQTMAGEWIRINVEDTGSGIPPDVLSHIFEPFFTTKDIGKGTGLGLAQVYGIVAQHAGHLNVTTQVGVGTTFTIYLPVYSAQQIETLSTAPQVAVNGQGEIVLVVEDDAALRTALVDSLALLNYQVLEATNAREALDMLETHAGIALVLSDVVMPAMGGIALFHALRDKGCSTPMILLTGHPMDKELAALQDQGLSAWLLKPPRIEQLAQIVSDVLRGNTH